MKVNCAISKDHSPRSIRTEADAVKCAAQLGLVFWVTLQVAQFMHAMGELTFITIFAFTSFVERTTQLGLVAAEEADKERLIYDRLSGSVCLTYREVFV
jgi:hypothetical protein